MLFKALRPKKKLEHHEYAMACGGGEEASQKISSVNRCGIFCGALSIVLSLVLLAHMVAQPTRPSVHFPSNHAPPTYGCTAHKLATNASRLPTQAQPQAIDVDSSWRRMIAGKVHGRPWNHKQSMHDPTNPFWPVRPGQIFTVEQVFKTVTGNGHLWCAVTRDNWSCTGARYEQVLRKTKPYNQSYTIELLPQGSRVFAEGNSYFAQLVMTIVCNSKVELWQGPANDYLAYSAANDAVLLLLDNDNFWNYQPSVTVAALHRHFHPTAILLGNLNNNKADGNWKMVQEIKNWYKKSRGTLTSQYGWTSIAQRAQIYRRNFPAAIVVNFAQTLNLMWKEQTCRADFQNCRAHPTKKNGHQCMPGPVNVIAERLYIQLQQQYAQHSDKP